MLNKLLATVRHYQMILPGDRIICAVSGGADSMAMLFALYLLCKKLEIQLEAAHFNHHLRGEESNRDEAFVRSFCNGYNIPLHVGEGCVVSGEKGLEAAARDARYAFLKTLPGKIATAHTANDNAETVLMHLIRGTGLRGLGGITPASETVIRPMLDITREEILAFLDEYSVPYVTDSSNSSDQFLRNRVRHHVMPLLAKENPRLFENVSAMAQRLRQDDAVLSAMVGSPTRSVSALRNMPIALRRKALTFLLEEAGVREPEAEHIELMERVVFSDKPSAKACFAGGITLARNYDLIEKVSVPEEIFLQEINCPGETLIKSLNLKVICVPTSTVTDASDRFSVAPCGTVYVRSRAAGDMIRLKGGTKSVKKIFIDRKIPAVQRPLIPVLTDDAGVLAVYGIGADQNRLAPIMEIRFEKV